MGTLDMDQHEVAQKVIDLFKDLEEVQDIYLRGSLADGIIDRYSDIDIGIDVSGYDNARFTQVIIDRMSQNFDLHFYDWATSLLPDSYVLTFFIKELPVFWNVDFDCTATPHAATLDREKVRNTLNPVTHTLKAWVHMNKYYIRRQEGIEKKIRQRGLQWLPDQDTSQMSPDRIMRAILDDLHRRSNGAYETFFETCYRTLE